MLWTNASRSFKVRPHIIDRTKRTPWPETIQKQLQKVFYEKRCSWKSRKIHRKASEACRPATLLKKRLWHRCFPVNFAKFWRTLFLHNISGRLLLTIRIQYFYKKKDMLNFHHFSWMDSGPKRINKAKRKKLLPTAW